MEQITNNNELWNNMITIPMWPIKYNFNVLFLDHNNYFYKKILSTL